MNWFFAFGVMDNLDHGLIFLSNPSFRRKHVELSNFNCVFCFSMSLKVLIQLSSNVLIRLLGKLRPSQSSYLNHYFFYKTNFADFFCVLEKSIMSLKKKGKKGFHAELIYNIILSILRPESSQYNITFQSWKFILFQVFSKIVFKFITNEIWIS